MIPDKTLSHLRRERSRLWAGSPVRIKDSFTKAILDALGRRISDLTWIRRLQDYPEEIQDVSDSWNQTAKR